MGAIASIFVIGLLGQALRWWRGEIDLTQLRSGDIIFQESTSEQSQAITLATRSRYTHMGIVFADNENYYVLEAVQPVKLTPLRSWITRGKDGHFVVKRLNNSPGFSPATIRRANAYARKLEGKDYDPYFEWSDDRLYCSELVWKIYQHAAHIELTPLRTLDSFDLTSPAVKQKLAERYGASIPLEEPVVSPADIFNAPVLTTIMEN